MRNAIRCWLLFAGLSFFLLLLQTPAFAINVHGNCSNNKIDTALGCLAVDSARSFTIEIFGRAVFLAGGIAFLLMLSGALIIIVSSGNPDRIKAGSELIGSALAGLIFIIFSLFLLRIIGVEFLSIPGL